MDPTTVDFDDIWLAHIAYETIISIMTRESVDKLEIRRVYLHEILSEDILEISSDGLPTLKPFALVHFLSKGIKTKFYDDMVRFSLPYLKTRANMEKSREKRKKAREVKEREERERLIKLFQSSKKNE